MNKKFLHSQLLLKNLEENGIFSGYASVFNVVDKQNDLILPGAFKKNLNKNRVKLLWQHDPSEPIGNIIDIYENDIGLCIIAHLLLDVQKAKDVYFMLKAGAIDGLSIGYVPVKYDTDHKTGVRVLKQVELWEVSLVTFPANSSAHVIDVKSQSDEQEMLATAIQKANAVLTAAALDCKMK